ncbi:tyrosine-type recombinase/integrase [Methylobacterium sp. WL12]|uniref:site-specific integrase n=1 Tax=Methylobacterium sp. WL12 TaxID=2603890 RepID=UPI00164F8D41|nr:tyrosine-type recombinase/integrase [Methylobacterium sp. WL12]
MPAVSVPTPAAKPVTFEDLSAGWAAEKRPAAKTLYEWSRVVRQFTAFLGRTDAASVTPDDLIAWKEAMIREGRRPKTIRDAKLAPVRAILQWAVDNRRLKENPAARVSMDVKSKVAESIRSFTDQEAAFVLKAALAEANPVLRWVPWLCAYSGARVSEVCQLRTQDVVQVDGIWCLRFDPEAGPLKTASSERAVPLHLAVLDSGFLTFAQGIPSGPLFPKLKPDVFGKRGGNGTKVLGRWVRGLGLTDERLAPNHSWRHRLKTLGRRHGLAPDLMDAITGHGRRTVADSYGEYEMSALYRELMKIPMLNLPERPEAPCVPDR